jgi:hypothetical protein
MRRLIIHLVVWVCTFTIGLTVQLIFTAGRNVSNTNKAVEIGLASLDASESPAQSSITLPAPYLSSDYGYGKFNPSGDYYPVDRMEDESEKSVHFDLRVRRSKGRLAASGEIRNVGTYYKFVYILITERRLKFTTLNIRGVEYRFDGRFIGTGDFASQTTDEGQIMLEGRLQKFINGEKVAETVSPFLYFPGC